MTLRERGFRFVYRGRKWAWVDQVMHGDIDGTDLSEAAFDALVVRLEGEAA